MGGGGEREITWRNLRRYHEDHELAIGSLVKNRTQQPREELVGVTLVPHEQVYEHRVPFRGSGDPFRGKKH